MFCPAPCSRLTVFAPASFCTGDSADPSPFDLQHLSPASPHPSSQHPFPHTALSCSPPAAEGPRVMPRPEPQPWRPEPSRFSLAHLLSSVLPITLGLAVPIFLPLQASIPPTGKSPQLPFMQTHFFLSPRSPSALPQAPGAYSLHSKDTAINLRQTRVSLPPPGIPARSLLASEQIASPALPLPRPLLLLVSWIPGQHLL